MCRQRAGCNAGTAKADGQRAWWQLPRGIWKVFRVLSVWNLANGRLECPNNRGLCAGSCREEAVQHLEPRKRGSTPAVVPGAAPALAKAGVGGYTNISIFNIKYRFGASGTGFFELWIFNEFGATHPRISTQSKSTQQEQWDYFF